jgi:hypothetical protein
MTEVFPIGPATNGPVITFGIAALVLLGFLYLAAGAPVIVFGIIASVVVALLFFLGTSIYAPRHVRLELPPEGLAIRGDLYGRGWFRLANGDKALIFVTDKRCVVYLPNSGGLFCATKRDGTGKVPGRPAANVALIF